jgi:hypothetical protein
MDKNNLAFLVILRICAAACRFSSPEVCHDQTGALAKRQQPHLIGNLSARGVTSR